MQSWFRKPIYFSYMTKNTISLFPDSSLIYRSVCTLWIIYFIHSQVVLTHHVLYSENRKMHVLILWHNAFEKDMIPLDVQKDEILNGFRIVLSRLSHSPSVVWSLYTFIWRIILVIQIYCLYILGYKRNVRINIWSRLFSFWSIIYRIISVTQKKYFKESSSFHGKFKRKIFRVFVHIIIFILVIIA